VHDLLKGVHATIGPSGANDEWLVFEAQCFGNSCAKEPHDRVVLGLVREATKGLTVVGQVEAPALRGA
jgi:hypothetical protein